MRKMLSGVLAAAMLSAPLSSLAEISFDARVSVNPAVVSMLAGDETAALVTKVLDAATLNFYSDDLGNGGFSVALDGTDVITMAETHANGTYYAYSNVMGGFSYTMQDVINLLVSAESQLNLPQEATEVLDQYIQMLQLSEYWNQYGPEIVAVANQVFGEIVGGFDENAIANVLMTAMSAATPGEAQPFEDEDLPGITQVYTIDVTDEQITAVANAIVDVFATNTTLASYADMILPSMLGEGVTFSMLCDGVKAQLPEIPAAMQINIYTDAQDVTQFIDETMNVAGTELSVQLYPITDEDGNNIGLSIDLWPDDDTVYGLTALSINNEASSFTQIELDYQEEPVGALYITDENGVQDFVVEVGNEEQGYAFVVEVSEPDPYFLMEFITMESGISTAYDLMFQPTETGLVASLSINEEELGNVTITLGDTEITATLNISGIEFGSLIITADDNSALTAFDVSECVSISGMSLEAFIEMMSTKAQTAVFSLLPALMPYMQ